MAGVMKGKAWGLGILMMVVVLGVWEVRMASAAVSAAKCKEERRLGINACKAVVYGKSPTPACCHRMRVTHLGCVCSVITPKLAALVDVNRMIELVKGCGRKLPRHYKCGNKARIKSLNKYHLSIKMNQFQNEEIELLFGLLCVMESTKRIVPLE
uniref:Bifunctional inhibitor/plant lipid transfer protein/seed storage helical domain-containing protein n=1 Tax=Vitis vinifera TaxID=29760 RepID=F6H7Y3_VITVI